jgi:hypothetical protein
MDNTEEDIDNFKENGSSGQKTILLKLTEL